MGNSYSLQTLKVKAKMASQRMKAHQSKKENQLVKAKRAIATLLNEDKEQSARIKVEAILREEDLIRVMEWLQMMCDLVSTRIKQIDSAKVCPDDMLESVCTILYCAKRIEIPELTVIGGQFKAKWGQKWFENNVENRSGRVSKQIIEKLSTEPPSRDRVDKKLKKIADKFEVDWEPGTAKDEDNIQIVGHKNEYTVEFNSKPFGMEWTATEDGDNLWVSNVTPMSQSAKKGVVPGSMLVAFNGKDIQNLGAPSIHERAATIGLPLRITFRKPNNLNAPKNKGDFSVREKVVNTCVKALKNPTTWDYSEQQKVALCKKYGANPAEIASAVFLVGYIIEKEKNKNDDDDETDQKQQQQQIPQQKIVYVQQMPQQNNMIPIQQQQQFIPQQNNIVPIVQNNIVPMQGQQGFQQMPMQGMQAAPVAYQQQQQVQPLPGLTPNQVLPNNNNNNNVVVNNGNVNPQQIMNGTTMGGNNNNNNNNNNDNNNVPSEVDNTKKDNKGDDGDDDDDEPPPGNNDDGLDDLEKRFAALKNGL